MRLFWYLGALACGILGSLGVLRVAERLVFGGGEGPLGMQALFGIGFLGMGLKALRKARAPLLPRSGSRTPSAPPASTQP